MQIKMPCLTDADLPRVLPYLSGAPLEIGRMNSAAKGAYIMSDRFKPLPIDKLAAWIFRELEARDAVFGVPRQLFYQPRQEPFALTKYGKRLDTPIGVAAGPHTQLAQNIITAYLLGARYIELKTVQTLDELEISRPCIDMEDEGYNCEWSQELNLRQSFDEYLNAWILIYALRDKLNWGDSGSDPGFIFNMSVGYNLEGIHKPNVQEFLALMADSSGLLEQRIAAVSAYYPDIRKLNIPARLSDNITLSTMHGCPPDEIERIGRYLITDLKLHTTIKLNPTLLGPDKLRDILNRQLGFTDISVPDSAFEHDPQFIAAAAMVRALSLAAQAHRVEFGVKLSNTLEVINQRAVFPEKETMMYMSGRPLHPLTVNLAAEVLQVFDGQLSISFAGGADAFNLPDLAACGLVPVTVCSDILKPGGYSRLPQYLDVLRDAMIARGASSPDHFICETAARNPEFADGLVAHLRRTQTEHGRSCMGTDDWNALQDLLSETKRDDTGGFLDRLYGFGRALGWRENDMTKLAAESATYSKLVNIKEYAGRVVSDERYRAPKRRSPFKNNDPLSWFDCIAAPCQTECPAHQNIPDYMFLTAEGEPDEALAIIRDTNAMPRATGCVCDHPCVTKCVRNHYDQPLGIRQIKRFAAERGKAAAPQPMQRHNWRVAIIGCGPGGLSAAYFLAREGYQVTIFEAKDKPGGMVSSVIPSFRLTLADILADVAAIEALGVEIRYNQEIGSHISFASLQDEGYDAIIVAAGARAGLKLNIPGGDHHQVMDCIKFLEQARSGALEEIGPNVIIIGGGNSAMDAARTAWRMTGPNGRVTVVYRRTIKEMPADIEELDALLKEGVDIVERVMPFQVVTEGGKLIGLECLHTQLIDADASGRPRPVPILGSEFIMPADAIIVGISQRPVLEFLDDTSVSLERDGTIRVNPITMEATSDGIYAIGDVMRGPATVIKAIADGQWVARSIMRRDGIAPSLPAACACKHHSLTELLQRKARRQYPAPFPELSVAHRRNFSEVLPVLTEAAAQREAERCLQCDELCSLCVTVCPNRANQTYEIEPFAALLPDILVTKTGIKTGQLLPFRVEQQYQIVNIGNFCNECGNCTTFCPTDGRPFHDKPTLYLDRWSYETEGDRALFISRRGEGYELFARWKGIEHHLFEENGEVVYHSSLFRARFTARDFALIDIIPGELPAHPSEAVRLEDCASLYIVLKGITRSLPHLIFADQTDTGAQ